MARESFLRSRQEVTKIVGGPVSAACGACHGPFIDHMKMEERMNAKEEADGATARRRKTGRFGKVLWSDGAASFSLAASRTWRSSKRPPRRWWKGSSE